MSTILDAACSRAKLIAEISKLETGVIFGNTAETLGGMELRAAYIKKLMKLVCDHVNEMADDVLTNSRVGLDDRYMRADLILDVAGDIAGAINEAVETAREDR